MITLCFPRFGFRGVVCPVRPIGDRVVKLPRYVRVNDPADAWITDIDECRIGRRYTVADPLPMFARRARRYMDHAARFHTIKHNGLHVTLIGPRVFVVSDIPSNGGGVYDVVHVVFARAMVHAADEDRWLASAHVFDGGGRGDNPIPGLALGQLGAFARSPEVIAYAIHAALVAMPSKPNARVTRVSR